MKNTVHTWTYDLTDKIMITLWQVYTNTRWVHVAACWEIWYQLVNKNEVVTVLCTTIPGKNKGVRICCKKSHSTEFWWVDSSFHKNLHHHCFVKLGYEQHCSIWSPLIRYFHLVCYHPLDTPRWKPTSNSTLSQPSEFIVKIRRIFGSN